MRNIIVLILILFQSLLSSMLYSEDKYEYISTTSTEKEEKNFDKKFIVGKSTAILPMEDGTSMPCKLIESTIVHPVPKIKNVIKQEELGVCYAAATLFTLEEAIQSAGLKRPTFSLSDAIFRYSDLASTQAEKKSFSYNGDDPILFITSLILVDSLHLLPNEPISIKLLSDRIKSRSSCSTSAVPFENVELAKEIFQFILDKEDHSHTRVKIPPFTLQLYLTPLDFLQNNEDKRAIIKSILKSNSVVNFSISDHTANIYGLNKYLCPNQKEITTYLFLDSCDQKDEILESKIISDIDTLFAIKIKRKDKKQPSKIEFLSKSGLTYLLETLPSKQFIELYKRGIIKEEFEKQKGYLLQKAESTSDKHSLSTLEQLGIKRSSIIRSESV